MRKFATMVLAGLILGGVAGESLASELPKTPTYSKDVAPILNANCVHCHRPGDIGPMSLMSFEEVRPWAKSIRKYVENGTMPPWHADEGIGRFKNERRLDPLEIEMIARWVKRGAKEGDPADLPPAFTTSGGASAIPIWSSSSTRSIFPQAVPIGFTI